jgi:WD40 repeat protein
LAYSPDGKTIVAGAWDASVILYDSETGGIKRRFGRHPDAGSSPNDSPPYNMLYLDTQVAVSPDGTMTASRGWNKAVYIWDANTGRQIRMMKGFYGQVFHLKFSPDGSLLAASTGWEVMVWNVVDGEKVVTIKRYQDSVNSIAFSPDGRWLATGDHLGNIWLWDVSTFREKFVMQSPLRVMSIAFSPDGKILASADSGYDTGTIGAISLWDVATGKNLITQETGNEWLESIAFLPDGQTLLAKAPWALYAWDVSYWTNGDSSS